MGENFRASFSWVQALFLTSRAHCPGNPKMQFRLRRLGRAMRSRFLRLPLAAGRRQPGRASPPCLQRPRGGGWRSPRPHAPSSFSFLKTVARSRASPCLMSLPTLHRIAVFFFFFSFYPSEFLITSAMLIACLPPEHLLQGKREEMARWGLGVVLCL